MSKKLIIFILLFSFICAILFFPGCQPATVPNLTGGTISGQAALPESSSKDISGFTPIPGATVTVIDAQGNTHTTLTDSNGFYSFDNIAVKSNTIINIEKDTAGGGKIVFMEVIPQVLSQEENFYTGIADAESTALALVIEALINLGQPQEEINLEEIISAPGFAQLEEAIRQAQENTQDIMTLSFIIAQAEVIADYIVNTPPAPTPSPPPVPSSAKEILTYGFEAIKNIALSSDATGIIDSTGHTVSSTVPYGTDVTSLVATFTLSAEATTKVEATSQVSGTTSNDFTFPITYTIAAEDNSTQDWIVTVNIAQPIRYVATTGNNANNGSEASPWETIQYALDNIPSSGTILVKGGIYHESISFPTGKMINLRNVNQTSPAIIIGEENFATVSYSNSLEDTSLEGFAITHNTGDKGRGITTSGPNFLTIKNCVIYNNDTNEDGGGIYNASDSILTIIGSTISDNDAEKDAGGIYNQGTLTITDSTISDNYGSDHVGGIYSNSTLTITDSTISGNGSENYGGVENDDDGTSTIISSIIFDNTGAHAAAGGIQNSGTLTITDSTISGNDAGSGGGIFNSGTLTLTGSTISDNDAGECGGGIYNYSGTLTITGSTIYGNHADHIGGVFLYSETNVTIGGSSDTNKDNFNNFTDNYITGSPLSADQHIRKKDVTLFSVDCHTNYPNNNFTPGP